jgi:hypothetical protein
VTQRSAVRPFGDRSPTEVEPQLTEHAAGEVVLVGHHQMRSPAAAFVTSRSRPARRRPGTCPAGSRGHTGSRHRRARGRPEPGQALGTELLGPVDQPVERARPSEPPPGPRWPSPQGPEGPNPVPGEDRAADRRAPWRSEGRACRCRTGRWPRAQVIRSTPGRRRSPPRWRRPPPRSRTEHGSSWLTKEASSRAG